MENKNFQNKLKERRQNDSTFDEEVKANAKLRQQKPRKKKAALKQKAKEISKAKQIRSSERVKSQNIRKKAELARKVLPKESNDWARTVNHLIKNATPKRKSVLSELSDVQTNTNKYAEKIIGVTKSGNQKRILKILKEDWPSLNKHPSFGNLKSCFNSTKKERPNNQI